METVQAQCKSIASCVADRHCQVLKRPAARKWGQHILFLTNLAVSEVAPDWPMVTGKMMKNDDKTSTLEGSLFWDTLKSQVFLDLPGAIHENWGERPGTVPDTVEWSLAGPWRNRWYWYRTTMNNRNVEIELGVDRVPDGSITLWFHYLMVPLPDGSTCCFFQILPSPGWSWMGIDRFRVCTSTILEFPYTTNCAQKHDSMNGQEQRHQLYWSSDHIWSIFPLCKLIAA